VLRHIIFRRGDKELGAVGVAGFKSRWKAIVRGNASWFDVIPRYDENGVSTGDEWRRCQTRDIVIKEMYAYFSALPALAAITTVTIVHAPIILLVIWRILSGSRT
jgi:hypothetical protein